MPYTSTSLISIPIISRKGKTILIGTDCHDLLEHCHCTTYGIEPYPFKNHDLALSIHNDKVWLSANSDKGIQLLDKLSVNGALQESSDVETREVTNKRNEMTARLKEVNSRLLDPDMTGSFIRNSDKNICFLLIDRPEFEKVRQMDSCQYPAFERVAAGEDPLGITYKRFRNRYLCKYVWKPSQFDSTACTGCGRCIEACIGGINKNELFLELYQVLV